MKNVGISLREMSYFSESQEKKVPQGHHTFSFFIFN